MTYICVSKLTIIGSDYGLRLVGAKPLSEPMLENCLLNHQEQTSVTFQLKFIHFHSTKFI